MQLSLYIKVKLGKCSTTEKGVIPSWKSPWNDSFTYETSKDVGLEWLIFPIVSLTKYQQSPIKKGLINKAWFRTRKCRVIGINFSIIKFSSFCPNENDYQTKKSKPYQLIQKWNEKVI